MEFWLFSSANQFIDFFVVVAVVVNVAVVVISSDLLHETQCSRWYKRQGHYNLEDVERDGKNHNNNASELCGINREKKKE